MNRLLPIGGAAVLALALWTTRDGGETADVPPRVDDAPASAALRAPEPLGSPASSPAEENAPAGAGAELHAAHEDSSRQPRTAPPAPDPAWKVLLRGRVVDPWHVGGATVTLHVTRLDGTRETVSVAADATGRFELITIGDGAAMLDVQDATGAIVSSPLALEDSLIQAARTASAEHTCPTLDLGGIVVGPNLELSVEFPHGEPDEAFALWLIPEPQGAGLRGSRRAGAQGAHCVGWLQPTLLARGTASEPIPIEVSLAHTGGTLVAVGEQRYGRLRLGTSGPLSAGQVLRVPLAPWARTTVLVERDDAPVANARTYLLGDALLGALQELGKDAAAPPGLAQARTDAAGRATLRYLPTEGRTFVLAYDGDRSTSALLTPDAPEQHLVFPRAWTTAGQPVRFVDGAGRPIDAVDATFDGIPLEHDGTTHRLPEERSVPPSVSLEAVAEGYVPVSIRVRPPVDPDGLDVTLSPEEPLRVAVVDQRGNPVAGARVDILGEPEFRPRGASLVTDLAGEALFPGMPRDGKRELHVAPPAPGAAWAGVHADGLQRTIAGRFAVPPGVQQQELVLTRTERPLHSIVIRARSLETGLLEVPERLEFTAAGERRAGPPSGVFLGNTEALVDAIAEGAYLVWIRTLAGSTGVARIDVSGDAREYEVPVGPAYTIEGFVRPVGRDNPLTDVRVSATLAGDGAARSPDEDLWPRVLTADCDAEGRFRIEGACAALYDLDVVRPFVDTEPLLLFGSEATAGPIELVWVE